MTADLGAWLHQIGGWIWIVVSALVCAVWGMLNQRIKETKATADAALSRVEYEKIRADSRLERQEIRGDIKDLFAKSDSVKDLMHQQVAAVEQRLSGEIDRMKSDMNGGFNRMQDIIEKRRA